MVVDRLGQGATGTVYRAQAPGTGGWVAVKELSGPLRTDPVALERLRREARLLAGLSHPNIVGVHDFVEEPDRAWLVCDYVDGAELSRVLAAHGRLGPEDALAVLHGALTGLVDDRVGAEAGHRRASPLAAPRRVSPPEGVGGG